MTKTPKELEVLNKKNKCLATTITKDDAYGHLTQYQAEEIFKKINSNFLNEKVILEAYKVMIKRDINSIDIADLESGLAIFADNMPHCLGELVLEKNKGLVTRMYDADFGHPFTTDLTATHLKIFGLEYSEIISRIKKLI